jgi:transposase
MSIIDSVFSIIEPKEHNCLCVLSRKQDFVKNQIKSWMTQAMKMDMQMQMLELGQRILFLTQSRKPKNFDWKKVEKLMYHKFKQFHYTEGLLYGL